MRNNTSTLSSVLWLTKGFPSCFPGYMYTENNATLKYIYKGPHIIDERNNTTRMKDDGEEGKEREGSGIVTAITHQPLCIDPRLMQFCSLPDLLPLARSHSLSLHLADTCSTTHHHHYSQLLTYSLTRTCQHSTASSPGAKQRSNQHQIRQTTNPYLLTQPPNQLLPSRYISSQWNRILFN